MKIRVTLLTENDKHINKSKDEIEAIAKQGWDLFANMCLLETEDPSERVFVEKCEVVEM